MEKPDLRKAIALKYDPTVHRAPKVLASGRGETAEQIIAMAQEHKIPVYSDPKLARELLRLQLNTEIPPYLYEAAASVIAFVYNLDRQHDIPETGGT